MPWQIVTGVSAGVMHEKLAEECGDVVRHVQRGAIHLALIADGAGSIEGSARFAESISNYMAQSFQEMPLDMIQGRDLAAILLDLYRGLRESRYIIDPMQGDSTLSMILVDESNMCILQVGDGFCVVREDAELKLVSASIDREYANETDFVSKVENPQIVTFPRNSIDFFALSSDGLAQVGISVKTHLPYRPFFQAFIDFLSRKPGKHEAELEIESFLRSAPLRAKVKDDVSLILGLYHND